MTTHQNENSAAPSTAAKAEEVSVGGLRPSELNASDTAPDASDATSALNLESPTPPEGNTAAPIDELYRLLGEEAVLLPVHSEQKAPKLLEWQNVTLEESRQSAYQGSLPHGNIGVLLGLPSNGLCAIDIDDDQYVEPFLELNPQLRGTLHSKGVDGRQIWVKVIGEYPPLVKIQTKENGDWGEWRATGGQSVIYGIHPSGTRYELINPVEVISVSFEDIVWPSNLKRPWIKTVYEKLIYEQGQPYYRMTGGGIVLNHMFFVARYATENIIVYDTTLKDFFRYDIATGCWIDVREEEVKMRFIEYLTKAAAEFDEEKILVKRNDALSTALMNALRTFVAKDNAFEARQKVIHASNGMLRLDTTPAELCTFDPMYFSRNICPFPYEPEAQCKRFVKELLETALPPDDVSLLQRWAGSVLLGTNTAQRFLLMMGTPGGGKSTLMTIIESVIGLNNVAQLRTQHLGERFEMLGFIGKTLLAGKDVPAEFLMQKGVHNLKALVGHDLLEAEKKGSNRRIQFVGDLNVGITCNSLLKIRLQGDIEAWRRRLLVIQYDRPKVDKRVADFASTLIKEEGAGIFAWMVAGAAAHLEELETNGDYVLSESQQERVTKLLAESDSVRLFIRDRVVRDDMGDVSSEELLTAYFDYCELMAWEAYGVADARKKIPSLMLECHHAAQRHDIPRFMKQVRGYKGFTAMP